MCYDDYMIRSCPLVNGQVYHVMNKSIAGYKIFCGKRDYERMLMALRFFTLKSPPAKFSRFLISEQVKDEGFNACVEALGAELGRRVQIIAYCIMPTHLHLVAKQLDEKGLSEMLRMSLNSYARYFNIKYGRKGTLFTGPFKNVLVENDGQLLNLTRYVHLNPVTAGLVDKPESWSYSSYMEYVQPKEVDYPLSRFKGLIDDKPSAYRKFVEDYKDYQRELALIKAQVLE